MPNFDGTGPLGKGSFTGRGMGFCVSPPMPIGTPPRLVTPRYPVPQFSFPCGRGRGLRPCGPYGRGMGFGYRWM